MLYDIFKLYKMSSIIYETESFEDTDKSLKHNL